jgi:hypothetical protein
MPDGLVVGNEEGVPQGGPLSPLLSNVVLDELDWELHARGLCFVRYAETGSAAQLVRELQIEGRTTKVWVAQNGRRHDGKIIDPKSGSYPGAASAGGGVGRAE